MLGRFADRLRVGEVLSEAFGSSGVVHDRGRLLVHLMLVLAGGGEACTDIETLRSQRGLFGEVASDSTLYRTLTGADEGLVESLAGAMATVRERVWADYPEGETVVLDIDSSVHELHSENKAGAAPTYNRKYGFHPMYCFGDWSGEPLAARLRRGDATPNQVSDLADVLDAAIGALPKRMRVGHSPGDDPAPGGLSDTGPGRFRRGTGIRYRMPETQHRVQFRRSKLRRDRRSPQPHPPRRPTLAACPSPTQTSPTQQPEHWRGRQLGGGTRRCPLQQQPDRTCGT